MSYDLPLINKQDGFEIVRNKIGEILATEQALQQALAPGAVPPEDPADYALKVYLERSNPWDDFVLADGLVDPTPIVCVWYDNGVYDMASSNQATRQKVTSRINVDCYGYAVSKDDPSGGHLPGDREGALTAQRAAKLVRNILMSDKYKYLDLRGLVWRRWLADQTAYQPQSGGQNVQHIQAIRMAFDVDHNETIDQAVESTVELINVQMRYEKNGQLIAEMDINFQP